MTMNLGVSERLQPILEKVTKLMQEDVLDADREFHAEVGKSGDRWKMNDRQKEIIADLQAKARAQDLWNFWLTDSEKGYGLSTVEYAHLAEQMGWCVLGPQVFNCSAPDTGNMEVLERYGNEDHKKQWLAPLLESKIRSAYLMTEPDVASSDATNLQFEAKLEGDEYVFNGEKYWSSGAGDERCQVYILMARTAGDEAPRHAQHSMFVLAADTPGIEVLRAMQVFGHDDAPHGHMHLKFTNVRVPKSALLLGEGRGFEVSQGRLGPGRIHHCMRAIGQAERALQLMCNRSLNRVAFGRPLAKLGGNYDVIADCRIEIEQARLLCLKAAWMMDQGDSSAAAPWISKIKVIAPNMAIKVIDAAIQMHGGTGVSQDTPLWEMYTQMRTLRFADGPDSVHRMQVARKELSKFR